MKHPGREIQKSDVENLPQPVAHALQTAVPTLGGNLYAATEGRPPINLPVRQGRVLGRLTRMELYGDVG